MNDYRYADLVLSSNAVFTGLQNQPFKGSVAIKENVILAVGTEQEIRPFIGEQTKVMYFGEQLIMPGFNDFHTHLFLGSLSQESVTLNQAKSEQEVAEMVKIFADSRPTDRWIFGFRWYHVYWDEKKLPHRSTLDKLIPDRPVFLFNDECHGAWVNSKALELLGIDKDTPNPPFGEIMRDEDGEATGFLYETAMTYAKEVFESIPIERQEELLQNFLKTTARLGITSVSDMLPLPGLELGNLSLYKQFDVQNKLTTRIHFLAALNGDLEHPRYLREVFNSEKLKFSGLKQFLDGVPITYTAFMIDPYTDNDTTRGNTLIPIDVVKEWTKEADKENFRIRLHACGDGAVRLGLDCFEAAQRQNGQRDSRHTIEHIEVIHPDDMDRFSELDVIASFQPEHMAVSKQFATNTYRKRLGKEREKYTWPINSIKDSGAPIAFGTDFPVVGLDPLTEIYRAVTRVHDDGYPIGGWNPSEKISLAEALRFYTLGSAYGVFRESELGTLEKGKLADVIVLDRNLFNVGLEEIRDTRVALTVMDGKVVYYAEDL
ncbi:amidohydrolase family protein [Aquibacillus halophilus]|uniref:Amidohydrolase family protein n=1 Tax=Aquibacillus halophilus TaxID=930132 RepID=A0A6A8D7X7_9BACI|nr:amidohydrolase [Aquibacillus halophilus]MRH41708.1 amidohydrolase family protein [Aquibacillus halophilus]